MHIHLSYLTSKIFKLFKNTTYNVQQAIFGPFYFALKIRFHEFSQWFKFDSKFNGDVQELQEKQ